MTIKECKIQALIANNPSKRIIRNDADLLICEYLKQNGETRIWVTAGEIARFFELENKSARHTLACNLRDCVKCKQRGRMKFKVVQVKKEKYPREYLVELIEEDTGYGSDTF